MNDEQLLEINKVLSDVWKMVKRNRDIREDDDYWKDLRNQGAEIFEIHGKSDFAKQIVMDTLMEIQRISKEQIINGQNRHGDKKVADSFADELASI